MTYLETARGSAHILNIAVVTQLAIILQEAEEQVTMTSVLPTAARRYGLLPFEPEFDPCSDDEPYEGYFRCDLCEAELVGSDPLFAEAPFFFFPICATCMNRQIRKGGATLSGPTVAVWLRDAAKDLAVRTGLVGVITACHESHSPAESYSAGIGPLVPDDLPRTRLSTLVDQQLEHHNSKGEQT